MNLLVTGGAGFIGSNFIRYVLRKYPEYRVLNLDKLTYAGNLENLKGVEEEFGVRYKFVKGDIADEKIVNRIVEGGFDFDDEDAGVGDKVADKAVERAGGSAGKFDVIINYAAETHVDRSITGPRDFITKDVLGTYTLLEATKKFGVGRYIQISTDEVYGSTLDGSFKETSPFMPNSPYSASKAGADHLCRAYFVTYGVPVIVTHSCNVYGPYQYPEKVIPLFVTNLIRGLKVPLYGDGGNVREWLFTEDHCSAIDVILHKGVAGEVYNIGSGHEITNLELTGLILKEFGFADGKDDRAGGRVGGGDGVASVAGSCGSGGVGGISEAGWAMIEYVPDRLGHDRRYSIDFTKLKKELGWEPLHKFEEALKETVKWYKENELWWKKLLDVRASVNPSV